MIPYMVVLERLLLMFGKKSSKGVFTPFIFSRIKFLFYYRLNKGGNGMLTLIMLLILCLVVIVVLAALAVLSPIILIVAIIVLLTLLDVFIVKKIVGKKKK